MKNCTKCGAPAADNELVCSSCGASLSADAAQQQPVQQPEQPQNYSYQQPNQQQYQQQPDQQQYQQQPYQQQYQQQSYQQQGFNQPIGQSDEPVAPRARTKSEFFKTDGSKYANSCIGSAVMCYISAAITLIVLVLIMKNPVSLIDVGILVGLGLGIQLKQNIPCAIILLVYAIINVLITMAALGKFGGWLVLLAGIFGTINTVKAQNAWKEYQKHTAYYDSHPQAYQQQAYNNPYAQPIHQEAPSAPQGNAEPAAGEWKCPKCGKINKNYVGTCGCGEEKPR